MSKPNTELTGGTENILFLPFGRTRLRGVVKSTLGIMNLRAYSPKVLSSGEHTLSVNVITGQLWANTTPYARLRSGVLEIVLYYSFQNNNKIHVGLYIKYNTFTTNMNLIGAYFPGECFGVLVATHNINIDVISHAYFYIFWASFDLNFLTCHLNLLVPRKGSSHP